MYAIIRDRGNQYKVAQGDVVELDLLKGANEGDSLEFEVMLTSDGEGKVQVGAPLVEGAKATGSVLGMSKGKKIDVVHFRRRKDSMTKVGHRAKFTRVRIDSVG